MIKTRLFAVTALSLAVLAGCGGSSSSDSAPPVVEPVPFSYVEATVSSLHTSLETGGVTCEEVIQGYIDRIHAYDDDGTETELRSVVNINPDALFEAREKDLNFEVTGIDGPLYCVPVLPKDNFNTKQMPTTGGAIAFQYNRPLEDAYTIRRLREAGAIIIGKANMDEFVFGFTGASSLRGLVKNAYDQSKGAGVFQRYRHRHCRQPGHGGDRQRHRWFHPGAFQSGWFGRDTAFAEAGEPGRHHAAGVLAGYRRSHVPYRGRLCADDGCHGRFR